MTCDVLIVGASFAGLACARAAALAGLRVTVVEKKKSSGQKLHTTGIIVKDAIDSIAWLQEVPAELVRRIEGVRLYAPAMHWVDLHAPGYYFWATDAERLLDWMVDSVRQLGVDVRLGTLFEKAHAVQTTAASAHTASTSRWQVPLRTEAGEDMLYAGYLVGADGPHSRVAKALGLSVNQHFLFGIEHEYREATLQENFLHCFIDKQLAPGYIGWALAGVGVSQVGLARRMPAASTGPGMRQVPLTAFLNKISPVVQVSGPASSIRAGMIPCGGVLPHVARPGAVLVGDAAGMVSPVTAGGIHTALRHGEQVGQGIANFLRKQQADPAEYLAASYPKFRAKRALRYVFDHCQTDWMFNTLLGTKAMRRAAELIYFHRKA